MLFKDIIGQEDVKNRLRLSVQENRIPHTQLFTGCSGVGKLPLAMAYAQYINCENRTPEDSCGCCPTCLQMQKMQSPDLHFVFPVIKQEGDKEAPVSDNYIAKWREQILANPYFDLQDWHVDMEDVKKQSLIYERESSEILRKLSLKSFGNGYKIMIIWLPEKMNETCSNKLLKILEEPPEQTIFLMVTEAADQLLATITSRAQEIHLENLDEKTITQELHSRLDMDISEAVEIGHLSEGSWMNALKLARNNAKDATWLEYWTSLMRKAWSVGHRQDYEALQDMRNWATEMSKLGREKQKDFLQYCQRQTRENFIRNYGVSEAVYQTSQEQEFSKKFAPFIHTGNVEQLMQQFELTERQITQNGNASILFFDMALQMIVLIK